MVDIQKRKKELLAQEKLDNKEAYWWMSFAYNGFRGVVITKSLGHAHALDRSHRLGVNPGGEVRSTTIPINEDTAIYEKYLDRLLSKKDLLENDLIEEDNR